MDRIRPIPVIPEERLIANENPLNLEIHVNILIFSAGNMFVPDC